MSNLIQHVTYIGEGKLFADEINQNNDGIYCLVLLDAKTSSDYDVETMVLEAMEKANAIALYSDILIQDGQFSSAQAYPSYFTGLLNSGLIIQSPIFVKNNERLKLEYNPDIKIFHGHNYLRQIQLAHRIIHIPELLYEVSFSHNNMLDIRDDLKILNG